MMKIDSGVRAHLSVPSAARIVQLVFLFVVLLLGWARFAEFNQIARARGQVIASARTLVIQSANDGVVESVLIREGEKVEKRQLLAKLDRSQAEAALGDSQAKVAALQAALTRLRSEVFRRPLDFPESVRAYPAFVQNQRDLYQRRKDALDEEIAALQKSLVLVREELTLSEKLVASGDIGRAEIIRLQRQVAEIGGQITNRRNKFFQDAQAEMTKAEEELATQQQLLAERTAIYERTDIVAPAAGIVRNIQITTPGAKVRPGDVVMDLLPTGGELVIEAKLSPTDVAFVHKGLPVAIKFDSYDYSIYGVVHGEVLYVSPDALSERTERGEQTYFRVQVRVDQTELDKYNQGHPERLIDVQPGLTAVVEIQTGTRTAWQYFFKPVTKTLGEAFGER